MFVIASVCVWVLVCVCILVVSYPIILVNDFFLNLQAQQENSDFLIKPQSNNVSICNCTGNEPATLTFNCAVKDADQIVWVINEASVDKNKYPYSVSSYNSVMYSSLPYKISGDSDEIMVQCQLRRESMTSISEAATISVISKYA